MSDTTPNMSPAASQKETIVDIRSQEEEASTKDVGISKDELKTAAAPGVEANPNTIISQPDQNPPDGGREAWLCVVGGVCSWFVTFGWVYSVGTFQEYYSQGPLRNYSPSDVAWISAVEVFFVFACGTIAGKLFDNYGARELLLVGSFMHVFRLMMASLGSQYYQFFLAQSVCSGIGVSLLFFASVNSAMTWFLKKRATAQGIMTAGSSIGGVVLPIMITRLIPDIGFPWTLRTLAFIFLALLVVTNLTMKSRLIHTPKPFHPMEFVRPLRDPSFAALCTAGSFVFLGSFLPYNFIVLQAQRDGMSYSLSNYLISVMNAASFPGRLIFGIFGDRYESLGYYTLCSHYGILPQIATSSARWRFIVIDPTGDVHRVGFSAANIGRFAKSPTACPALAFSVGDTSSRARLTSLEIAIYVPVCRFNMMALASAIATIFTFCLWIPSHSRAAIFVFAAINGFTSGAIFSVGPAAIAQISEIREIGVRNGTLFFCVAIGVLIGNPIGGALISTNAGDYLYLKIFSGVLMAASCVMFFVSRSLKTGFLKVKIFLELSETETRAIELVPSRINHR